MKGESVEMKAPLYGHDTKKVHSTQATENGVVTGQKKKHLNNFCCPCRLCIFSNKQVGEEIDNQSLGRKQPWQNYD